MGAPGKRIASCGTRQEWFLASYINHVSCYTDMRLMASLFRREGVFCLRFRFQGVEYKRSLKTHLSADADCAKAIVEQTLYRLRTGHTTEEMRKRYRHLFPSRKAEAIRAISYADSPVN